jgi:outer membrane protein
MKYKILPALFVLFALTAVKAQQANVFTLQQCLDTAKENSKKIKAAQLQIDASKEAAEGAKLNNRPSIDGSFIGAHFGKPLSDLLPSVIGNLGVDVKQPIYAGGKIKLGMQATAKVVEIREGQKTITAAEVKLQVEKAYWQVVQVKEKIILADKFISMLTALQTDLQNTFDAGLTYKNDLLRVGVSLNEAQFNKVKAADGLVMAKLALAQAMGIPERSDFSIADSVTGSFATIGQQDFSAATRRPELNVLSKAIEAQQIQKAIIKADLKPTVGLAVSGFGAAGKAVNFTNGNNFMASYYALASVSVPIFEWGKNARKVKEQSIKIEAQKVEMNEVKELINLEVQNAWLSLNQSVKRIGLAKLSLQQADENLRLAQDRFEAGTIVAKDVQEAQLIWQQANNSVIDAKIEYKVNEAVYKKAIAE